MSTTPTVLMLAGLTGLLVGSFLNVVIYRVPRGESIVFGRSHCPNCFESVRNLHNVPVLGWLLLRGKCYSCRERISALYPLLELGTSLVFIAVTLRFGLTLELPVYLYAAAVLLALAVIDVQTKRLPDEIVVPSYIVLSLMVLTARGSGADWTTGLRTLVGSAAMFAMYLALALAFPRSLRVADAKLAGIIGLCLGWSWSALFIAAAGGIVIVALVMAVAEIATIHGRPVVVRLAPCLISAAFLSVLMSAPVSAWYSSLVSV